MHEPTPVFAASAALLPEAIDSAQGPAASVPSSMFFFLRNADLMSGQRASPRRHWGERTRSQLLEVALLVAAVATVVLVLHCFRALQSNEKSDGDGVNGRRLAKGGSGSCNVGLGRQKHGIHARPSGCTRSWGMPSGRLAAEIFKGNTGNVIHRKELWIQGDSRPSSSLARPFH